ncbi:MAG TPA: cysteine desulfurase family protein [Pirellulaceae bacterium]|nr:cysteine desulfurase family protein [Pirellulaceae bacterium]HMO90849.1 cysteine desulfurase family protein [Pirellulaceae bacterium]HMP68675.1 cysteine desulfurase family protein [Pirellulaceae bacterium]
MKQIYLDYNATTPVAPTVVEAMQPFFSNHYGNPSSRHALGCAAAEGIEDARMQVAQMIACDREDIVFTSGGTESNNLAIKGVMLSGKQLAGHMIISAIEHPSVVAPAKFLQRLGIDLTVVGCDADGVVSPEAVYSAMRADTKLISIMHSNNETGVIQPIADISKLCRRAGVVIHTDASQSAGKVPLSVTDLGVDLMTLAGHKYYAPKGIGALFVREGLVLEPVLHGAEHEQGMRAGTENTPYIIGLGEASARSSRAIDDAVSHMSKLRDRLFNRIQAEVGIPLKVNGIGAERLPNTLSIVFPEVTGYELLNAIPEICASTGAACHSDAVDMSPTLRAMGLSREEAAGTVRFSLGWFSREEEIDQAVELIVGAWEGLRVS